MALQYNIQKTETMPPVLVLHLDGQLDTESALQFGQVLELLLERHACPLVLDMTGVGYVSSAGWRAIIMQAKHGRDDDVPFNMAGMQPTVRELFELIGLHHLIPSHATVEEAVGAFARTGGCRHV